MQLNCTKKLIMNTRDKTDKFIFLANKRVNKAIKVLKLIGNLANKKNYSYSDEQVKKIIKALQKEVDSIRHNFQNSESVGQDSFIL